MLDSLKDIQTKAGAVFTADIPQSFPQADAALDAAQTGVALVDRSHWGRIQVGGDDRLRFLHNQTTNAFETLQPGQGCDTVFVTSTARTLDLATAYVDTDSVLLLTSPGQTETLLPWMDRYIFFADKVTLTDVTPETVAFTLIGPDSDAVLEKIGAGAVAGQPYASHKSLGFAGDGVLVAVGSGLALPGYTLIAPATQAVALWQQLADCGALPLGETGWQQLRVQQGRPIPGSELTDAVNPLEAGLWQAVSFEKGCYIGQETLARLNTYKGVKQQLWGLTLTAVVPPNSSIYLDGQKVGTITSVIPTETGALGLGYLRTKAGGAGLTVQVEGVEATVSDLPFASRGYLSLGT